MAKTRIHKVLAQAGVASRRGVEEMILEGRVAVNGRVVAELPCFVDPDHDRIAVDGRNVTTRPESHVYFLLNKPRGVVCTQRDPQGRPRAVDLVPPTHKRVYCVGRLDAETTGLIIITNDGALTEHVTHPRYGVVKTYVAQADGRVTGADIARLKGGMHIDGKRTAGAGVKVLKRSGRQTLLELRLAEGRNREIRRMLARLGHKVRRLKRTAIGSITDRGLKIGRWRVLTKGELQKLRKGLRAAKRPARNDK
ncbi:MAG: rRNA pseudouridine synthase [Phycisphaerae bacterium]|nr:rRNA pseudouridine synthase [Phycisphaerae bacterium]